MSFVIWYLDILEIVTLISKLFEAERLLPLGLQPLVFETITNIDNCINASIDDDLLTIFVCCLSFLKADDRTRSNSDRQHVSIAFGNMTDIDETVEETKCFEKSERNFCGTIFCLSDPIYQNVKWLDPKNLEDDVAYGSKQIEKFASRFKDPLEKANFDRCVVHKE